LKQTTSDTDAEIVSFFERHLVPMIFTFTRSGDTHHVTITAFVLSVADEWFLVTAAHCLRLVDEMSAEPGCKFAGCRLVDSLGPTARHFTPIPFAYEQAAPICVSEDPDYDYGVIPLSGYYRQLLDNNGIVPLNEEVWRCQPSDPDFYLLVGMPSELFDASPSAMTVGGALLYLDELCEKPDGFSGGDGPMFYGRLSPLMGLGSIKGMSGGPVLAFKANERKELRYWVVALQSRWLPDSRYIAACRTDYLGARIALALTMMREAATRQDTE
jgi:hypothetical protein